MDVVSVALVAMGLGLGVVARRQSLRPKSDFAAVSQTVIDTARRRSYDISFVTKARLSVGAASVLSQITKGVTQKVKQPVSFITDTTTLDPYGLLSATAMARTVISWCSQGPAAAGALNDILRSSLREDEKIRAIVIGIVLPCLTGIGPDSFHVDTKKFRTELSVPWLYAWANAAIEGGTELQRSQIVHALVWCGYYLLSPVTYSVMRGASLYAEFSAIPAPLYFGFRPVEFWKNANWIKPDPEQRWRAIMDLFVYVIADYRSFWGPGTDPDAEYSCAMYDPNPCRQVISWIRQVQSTISDANNLSGNGVSPNAQRGDDPVAIEGACQATLQMTTRFLLAKLVPKATIPPPDDDVFSKIAAVIGVVVSAVATVFTAGAAAGLVAGSVAVTFSLVAGAASTAVGLAAAVAGSKNAGDVINAALSNPLVKQLTVEAHLLAPPELKAAAQQIKAMSGFLPVNIPANVRALLL